MIALIIALAAASPLHEPPVHRARLDHDGLTYQATYTPSTSNSSKTIGARTGPRASVERCRVSTVVTVARTLTRRDDAAREVPRAPLSYSFSDHLPGRCEEQPQRIAEVRMRRALAVGDQLPAIAAADRPALLAELEAWSRLASN